MSLNRRAFLRSLGVSAALLGTSRSGEILVSEIPATHIERLQWHSAAGVWLLHSSVGLLALDARCPMRHGWVNWTGEQFECPVCNAAFDLDGRPTGNLVDQHLIYRLRSETDAINTGHFNLLSF